jgi:hypothetical protein
MAPVHGAALTGFDLELQGFVAGEDKAARAAEEEELDDDEWSDLEVP